MCFSPPTPPIISEALRKPVCTVQYLTAVVFMSVKYKEQGNNLVPHQPPSCHIREQPKVFNRDISVFSAPMFVCSNNQGWRMLRAKESYYNSCTYMCTILMMDLQLLQYKPSKVLANEVWVSLIVRYLPEQVRDQLLRD